MDYESRGYKLDRSIRDVDMAKNGKDETDRQGD
jgi:hypothetical protein